MGLLRTLKKEIYINRLVRNYKVIFDCDDMIAIKNLRQNYDESELREIIKEIRENPNQSLLSLRLLFKDHHSML
jgi:hypothetical protein